MATVCLLGTLDTKGEEFTWLRDQVQAAGADTLLVDVGSFSDADIADVSAADVAQQAGVDIAELRGRRDRGEMMQVMATGSARVVRSLSENGRIDGFLALGGSGGSSVAAAAMQALPVGFPKLLVSTMASGDTRPYVGEVDTTLMYSVVDIAGLNSVSEMVLGNAAVAAAAMARRNAERRKEPSTGTPLVAVTMFGVTTPAADEARDELNRLGYETLVFHATGSGGKAMEKLVESGLLAGVVDLTTTELADELVGGVLTAGPRRLEAAGQAGLPQVVSVGALDMVNFGPRDTVPAAFDSRNILVHNPTVTLMRTTAQEMAELGSILGQKVCAARGPAEIYLPRRGVSAVDVPGGPFHDPEADRALFDAVHRSAGNIPVHDVDQAINDPGFGSSLAQALHRLITSQSAPSTPTDVPTTGKES